MTPREISPPASLAVSLAEAKDQLRIDQDVTSFDAQLTIWIAGIIEHAEHATGRVFVNRPMRLTLDQFEPHLRLSAPTFSIESIQFIDVDGQRQILDSEDYFLDRVTEPGYVMPEEGVTWPATRARPLAVTVNFTGGYGPDATTVPTSAKLYILARLTELWDPVVKEFKETVRSNFTQRLLDKLKVYG
jgi:uncharacterized phiE125 gp8 family phage protein